MLSVFDFFIMTWRFLEFLSCLPLKACDQVSRNVFLTFYQVLSDLTPWFCFFFLLLEFIYEEQWCECFLDETPVLETKVRLSIWSCFSCICEDWSNRKLLWNCPIISVKPFDTVFLSDVLLDAFRKVGGCNSFVWWDSYVIFPTFYCCEVFQYYVFSPSKTLEHTFPPGNVSRHLRSSRGVKCIHLLPCLKCLAPF